MSTNTEIDTCARSKTCVRTNTNTQDIPLENVFDVMKDLEEKVNPKSLSEGLAQLNEAIKTNDASILLNPMIDGAKEFEKRVGRPMTYVEMRGMWG
jgi:hypothetical protein